MNILASYFMCIKKSSENIFQGMFLQEHNIMWIV